jgi:hypothetical protein
VKKFYLLLLLPFFSILCYAQDIEGKIDPVKFFEDESMIDVTVTMDLRGLITGKLKQGLKFPAEFAAKFSDNSEITGPVTMEVRGKSRREICYLPPLKVDFKNKEGTGFSSLGSIKLVNVCEIGKKDNAEYLMKEYLIYKMYNLFTDKSFRVRLLRINYVDREGKRKPIKELGFLLEDVKDMAKRMEYVERKRPLRHTELAHRQQLTRVSMFEYMIGNTDWSVPARHNIKLIVSKADSNAVPFPVPYDFDHSGIVKTDYAMPPPHLEIKDVTQRLYRGFPRTMEELQEVIDEFMLHKEKMYKIIEECEFISAGTKKNMTSYLNGFYHTISQPKIINNEFIRNARKDYKQFLIIKPLACPLLKRKLNYLQKKERALVSQAWF